MARLFGTLIWAIVFLAVREAGTWAADGDALTPAEALKAFQLAEELRVELVAAEPEVVSPVAIAWDEFGRMFVVEMRDYPNGPGEGKPFLSRVKRLEDRDGDGRCETAVIFAEELPFANGVMPWNGGVIVTAAPDIWFLKDADGDGKAEIRRKLFTGFKEGNPQLRVNHPTLGIDNWIYVANGLSGGEVQRADQQEGRRIPIPQMDFRFRPDSSEFEATAGNAQFGLAFDDFGDRFVCSNRQHAAHVVLPDRYLKRNPHLRVTKTVLDIPDHGAAARIFPLTRAVTTAVEHAGSFTAACGLTVYRGTALGEAYRGNIFVCDPTGNLVHRDVLVPAGRTFVAKRADEEAKREFLASTDEWFRPVNLANGPDGALYVIDMHRAVIEHPQYMPKGLPETLDLRKGDDTGRIYRVVSKDRHAAAVRDWPGKLSTTAVVALLEHREAWWRETAQRLIIERQDRAAVEPLRRLLRTSENPLARTHALWTLEGLGELDQESIERAIHDAVASVREHAIRLAEPRLKQSVELQQKVLDRVHDSDRRVRFQVALAAGECEDALSESSSVGRRVAALADIARTDLGDEWTQIAVLSSSAEITGQLLERLFSGDDFVREPAPGKAAFLARLGSVIGTRHDSGELNVALASLGSGTSERDGWWQLAVVTGLADGLKSRGKKLGDVLEAAPPGAAKSGADRVTELIAQARTIAASGSRPTQVRVSAIKLLSHAPFAESSAVFAELLEPRQPHEVQLAAVQSLGTVGDPGVASLLLDRWSSYSPPIRREVLEAIFSRGERFKALLDAIEAGTIKAAELDTQRHAQLLGAVKEIQERARKLFADQGTPNRKEVIESFRSILAQSGDGRRGRVVFQKNCATCHRVAGDGHAVGPELTGMRQRSKEAILMDILDPNRALSPNFTNYLVATTDGRVLTGLIAAETATSITLRRAEGAEDTLLRQDVESIQATGQSLMPEGMERNVSQDEMLDLIEYLRTSP